MIDFSKIVEASDYKGNIVQIADAFGNVLWAAGGKTVLGVEKITADTYAGETTYTGDNFILLDIYPKTNGTVSITYGGLTKTIKDTSGAVTPNAQQVYFGTFNGVSDSVQTPASGELTIEGDYNRFAVGTYKVYVDSKSSSKYCSCITSIIDLGGATSVGSYAFYGCTKIASVSLPARLRAIEPYAFYGCTGLKSIDLSKVVNISSYAFSGCTGLTSVNLSSAADVYLGAFGGCSGLLEVHTNSLNNWCNIAFSDYSANPLYASSNVSLYVNGSKITSVTMPYTASGTYTFAGYKALTNVILPSDVTSVGSYVFYGCTGITSIDLSRITTISSGAFSGCTGLTSIDLSHVTTLGGSAFANCTGLTSVDVSNVSSFGASVFSGCTNLTQIHVNSLVNWCNIKFTTNTSNPLYALSGKASLYVGGSIATSITIPSGMVGTYSFAGCTSITSATFPSGITSVNTGLFYECTGLTSVSLPSGMTTIESHAFYKCTNLGMSSLPSSITTIRNNAFYNCTALALTSLPSGITEVGNYAFNGCSNLALASIPSSLTTIGNYTFYTCSALTITSLHNGITSIGQYAFAGCTGMKLSALPTSLTSLGSYAFRNCTGITLTSLPSGLKEVPSHAFEGCTGIKNINMDNVETIGTYAFADCGLVSASMLSIVSIAGYAFNEERFTSIVFGPNLVSIADNVCRHDTDFTASRTVSVRCLATTPPTLGSAYYSLPYYYTKSGLATYKATPCCNVIVPAGCAAAYQATDWVTATVSITEG